MQKPGIPANEETRLSALHDLNILDTHREERFDRLTRLAKALFGVPIVLISLVDRDRQWFKSCQGLEATHTGRDISFCGHAILGDDVFEVPDARLDVRFHDNPLVTGPPHIRFYASYPLRLRGGAKIGTLCLIDTQPRRLLEEEHGILRDLANMVEEEINAAQLAATDDLTGLSNRRGFQTLAQKTLDICRRLDLDASLLYLDLDGFKAINDTFGHAEGDRALIAFAELLRTAIRDSDVVARLGGDEFVVLMTNCSPSDSTKAQSRLDAAMAAFNEGRTGGFRLHYSVGSVSFDREKHSHVDDLLRDADARMFQKKRSRRAA